MVKPLFWTLLGLSLVPWFIPRGARRRVVARNPSVLAIRLVEFAVVAVYVWIVQIREWDYRLPALAWPGLALAVAGLILTSAAKLHLRTGFSYSLGVKQDHPLITTGPYARIRHPIYTGILTAMAGAALVFQSGAVLALLAAPFGLCFYWQSVTEEKLLEAHFGDAYGEYRRRAGRFLPRLTA